MAWMVFGRMAILSRRWMDNRTLRRYIKYQEQEDSGQAKLELG